jgi:cell division protein FtsB
MATGAAIVGGAGLGLQLYGMNKEAEARKAANSANAQIRRAQINDLQDRFHINKKETIKEGQAFLQIQTGQYAKGGVAVGEGSTLIAMESTRNAVNAQIKNERFELRRRINNLGTEAAMLDRQNDAISQGNRIGLMATAISGTANLMRAYNG